MKNTKTSKVAYEGPRSNCYLMDPDELVIIGLDTEDGPEHPLYDQRILLPLDPHVVANIKKFGVRKPCLMRKITHEVKGSIPVVIDGRQRVRMAREVNRLLAEEHEASGKKGKPDRIGVKCIPESTNDLAELADVSEATNVHIADDPITRAKKAARRIAEGRSQGDVATMFGVSPRTMATWLKLGDLDPKVQAHVAAGRLGITDAVKLSDLEPQEQRVKARALLTAAEDKSDTDNASTEPKQRKLSIREKLKRLLADEQVKKHKLLKLPASTIVDWVLDGDDKAFLAEMDLDEEFFLRREDPPEDAEHSTF